MARPKVNDFDVLVKMASIWVNYGKEKSVRELAERFKYLPPHVKGSEIIEAMKLDSNSILSELSKEFDRKVKNLEREKSDLVHGGIRATSKRRQRKFTKWIDSGEALCVGIYEEARAISYRYCWKQNSITKAESLDLAFDELSRKLQISKEECSRSFRLGERIVKCNQKR